MNYTIGIDVGTNKIKGVLVEMENKTVIDSIIRTNNCKLPSEYFENLQDPDGMYDIAKDIIDDLMNDLSGEDTVDYIGLCGQMHGFTYIDVEGNAISPHHNWQDNRGNRIYKNDTTYASYVKAVSLRPSTAGFALVTHFYNVENKYVPNDVYKITTIHGYVAMKLTGAIAPPLHTSDAQGFGIYDTANNCFEESSMTKLGIDPNILPEVSKKIQVVGEYKGAKVLTPIGQSQASFYGSAVNENTVLVNVTQIGQVSLEIPCYRRLEQLEARPYFDDSYLLVGTTLSGGHAYELLKNFYESTLQMFGFTPPEDMYAMMNMSAFEGYKDSDGLKVNTRFLGTRNHPNVTGNIENLKMSNFTPMHLSVGVLDGICNELFGLVESELKGDFNLVGAGNGIRQNSLMQKLFSDRFNKPITVPKVEAESAYGASLLFQKL